MKNLTYVIFVFALISCNQKANKTTTESTQGGTMMARNAIVFFNLLLSEFIP